MFNLFRRNCLYNSSIEPHCAYCAHCKPDNEYQGVCEFRGIVAMAGSCRRFTYNALRRKPPKPARIRGRFTDADFFFEENETAVPDAPEQPLQSKEPDKPEALEKPLLSPDLREFADLWEDDEPASTDDTAPSADEPSEYAQPQNNQPDDISEQSDASHTSDTDTAIHTPKTEENTDEV